MEYRLLAQRLVFVGHISVDKVENVNGTRTQPGGAALYAAMAARTLFPNVALISATGKDNKYLDVLNLLPHRDVKIYDAPSTKFHIKYDRRWEAHYLKADHGAGSRITSHRISDRWLRHKSIFHISPMRPSKVARILDKIKQKSPETKVSVNTWIDYIKGRRNRRILKDIAFRVAPIEKADALDMMQEIRAHKILEAVRGMPPADRDQLADILIKVGRIGLEQENIKEIDMNPVILSGSRPIAVDALVVLNPKESA